MRYLASLLLFVFCFAPLSAHAETNLGERLKGRILLQVESHGEAWYVNPKDGLRYYMPDGDAAYTLMRQESLGITNADLEAIPSTSTVDQIKETESVCASHDLAQRVAGHILLQVEDHGEAWYVDPDTCTRIYMKDGQVAYSIMHDLSLGITNGDLATIDYSSDNATVTQIVYNDNSTTVVNIIVEKIVEATPEPTAEVVAAPVAETPEPSSESEEVIDAPQIDEITLAGFAYLGGNSNPGGCGVTTPSTGVAYFAAPYVHTMYPLSSFGFRGFDDTSYENDFVVKSITLSSYPSSWLEAVDLSAMNLQLTLSNQSGNHEMTRSSADATTVRFENPENLVTLGLDLYMDTTSLLPGEGMDLYVKEVVLGSKSGEREYQIIQPIASLGSLIICQAI